LADERLLPAIKLAARGRPELRAADRPWWLKALGDASITGPDVVVFAAWVPAFGNRAVDLARQLFEDILSLGLLLGPMPRALGLTPLRGESHRPGIRGLALHRRALTGAETLVRELGAEIRVDSAIGSSSSLHWYGEEPVRLDRLIDYSADEIASVLVQTSALSGRLLVAARWLNQAHWADRSDDAALALGIALDALLAESGSSPGRVLSERFAFLEPDPAKRASRAERINLLYQVRSSIAHGAKSKEVDQDGFIDGMAADVRWAAHRLLDASTITPLRTEGDHAAFFARLKWGTHSLP
jgi:hypothetical protein